MVLADLRTPTGASLLRSLEAFLAPGAYSCLTPEDRSEFVATLAAHGWVETCVVIIKELIAASVSVDLELSFTSGLSRAAGYPSRQLILSAVGAAACSG